MPSVRAFRIAAICLPISLLAPSAHAGFSQASQSVPAQAMGGAFVAKADDFSALFINPAGLSRLRQGEAAFMYGKLLTGLSGVDIQQQHVGVAYPVSPDWTVAAGGSLFDASGLLREYEAILGGAYRLNRRLALGLNVSYLSHSYNVSGDALAAQDPVFANGTSKGAPGVDLGALATLGERWSVGLSGRHLNKPDVGLAARDTVPMELRGGALFQLERIGFTADLSLRDAGGDVSDGRQFGWSFGGEWKAVAGDGPAAFDFRAGFNRTQFTAGFGFAMGSLKLDYAVALLQELMGDSMGTHRLALGFRFGGRPESSPVRARRRYVSVEEDEPNSDSGVDAVTIQRAFGMRRPGGRR